MVKANTRIRKNLHGNFFPKHKSPMLLRLQKDIKHFSMKQKQSEKQSIKLLDAAKKEKKKIVVNREKSAAIILPGKKPVRDGLRIVISHIDSPRLDLKQVPLYQDSESHLALFETHYYGGIKKFQWVVIPLALHGVIVKKDGKKITFTLGEDEKDPVFSVPDLLPHLSHDVQDNKKIDEAIKGESLDIVIGSHTCER